MGTWRSTCAIEGQVGDVFDLLTDPEVCRGWSPVPIHIDSLSTPRLEDGTRARVGSSLAGRQVQFELEVTAADRERLHLHASGPFEIDVDYRVLMRCGHPYLSATVATAGGKGLRGRALLKACESLLRAGVLELTLRRICRDLGGDQLAAA